METTETTITLCFLQNSVRIQDFTPSKQRRRRSIIAPASERDSNTTIVYPLTIMNHYSLFFKSFNLLQHHAVNWLPLNQSWLPRRNNGHGSQPGRRLFNPQSRWRQRTSQGTRDVGKRSRNHQVFTTKMREIWQKLADFFTKIYEFGRIERICSISLIAYQETTSKRMPIIPVGEIDIEMKLLLHEVLKLSGHSSLQVQACVMWIVLMVFLHLLFASDCYGYLYYP